MERLYIYSGALAVIGLSIGLPAALSVLSGDHSIPLLLMTVGGAGMTIVAGYESLQRDPDSFEISASLLFALIAAACLSVLGTALSLL
ncbi:hypothetical protein [Halogeometricum luteum]|uniref:ZIP family metal transporter n=1 Tax=Halogeometricum luteum TaxID=2950537 RepID=A0ABU2FZQ8_9EURY|nr:hypothetical protein [Halogeometricum sp. S3BR5-2]MDS0294007.1 hypothetical protein [Halogeometricum sp. S3BR5-2]